MIRLTNAAQKRLDGYLQQMRACLRGCETVDADEVQRDITEHIETELEGTAEPVSVNQLDDVLGRLGSPSQWVPPEEATWWRKATFKLRRDAGNWPLAYVAFGLFLLFLLSNLIPIRWELLWPVRLWPLILWGRFGWVILLLASFCVARVALSTADSPDQIGARRWLIYPPLLFIYIPLCLVILLWPVLPTMGLSSFGNWTLTGKEPVFYHGLYNTHYRFGHLHGIWQVQPMMGLALWWAVLAVVLLIWPKLVRIVFRPFADWFNRKWAGLLLVIAILLIIVCVGPELLSSVSGGRYLYRPSLRWF